MRKTVFILFTALFAMTQSAAFAQLSTRENVEPYVFQAGTRPSTGDFSIFIGPSFTEIQDIFDSDVSFRGLPYLNFKYYKSQNLVFRIGLQLYSLTDKASGTQEVSGGSGEEGSESATPQMSTKNSDAQFHFRLSPAVEYHFSSKNLLDVYAGGFLPFGFDRYGKTNELTFDGKTSSNNVSQTPFVMGLGGFIGLQTFISDLPLAIGFEYGISWLMRAGSQYKYTSTDAEGKEQVYYSKEKDDANPAFTKLSVSKNEIGGDFRVTISYFFNR
jgi:hypothetical protein